MATPIQNALLSSHVYRDLRPNEDNVLPLPQGWSNFAPYKPSGVDGFSAGAYSNGSEIVISYAGTNFNDLPGDWVTNLQAGSGVVPAPQIFSAALYYIQVKSANLTGLPIRFTGHSLGGGLASLMAVFFNKEAAIFATATIGDRPPLIFAGPKPARSRSAQLQTSHWPRFRPQSESHGFFDPSSREHQSAVTEKSASAMLV